jgi:hypothetical protein
MTDAALKNYYYGSQLRRYIVSFMAVFSGLKVAIGKNDYDSQTNLIEVPIAYGSRDRVVAAILAENTQNKPIRVPTLSANMTRFELDDTLRVGVGQTSSETKLPLGSTLPNGLITVEKYRPVPYMMGMEVTVYASNTDQHFQMLEQILMLFDPILQIQTSDANQDWTKITTITLDGIGLEETYPAGTERRIITTSLSFHLPVQLSPPFNFRKDYIKNIKLRLDTVQSGQNVYDVARDVASQQPPPPYEDLINVDELNIPAK